MKPLAFALIFATSCASNLSIAQTNIDMDASGIHVNSVKNKCTQDAKKKNCVTMAVPPLPPTPSAPPVPPAHSAPPPPPLPPAPPAPADLPDPPALADLPPPIPPEPPKIVIPDEVHQACKNKSAGMKASWQPNKSTYYGGVCVQREGKLMLDVHQISLHQK